MQQLNKKKLSNENQKENNFEQKVDNVKEEEGATSKKGETTDDQNKIGICKIEKNDKIIKGESSENYESLFIEIFKRTNNMIKESSVVGGATALVLLFTDSNIFIASAGDCRCVMGYGDKYKRITTDHKPNDERERKRIESFGGEVVMTVIDGQTTARVNGILSVARAMGDFQLEQFITCDPDVFKLDISELNDNIFVAACDGLWDVVDDATAIKTVTEHLSSNADDVHGASRKLVELAFFNGSTDNISVVVMKK